MEKNFSKIFPIIDIFHFSKLENMQKDNHARDNVKIFIHRPSFFTKIK